MKKLGTFVVGAAAGIALVVACEQGSRAPRDAGGLVDSLADSLDLSVEAGRDAQAAPSDCPDGWHVERIPIPGDIDTAPGDEPFAVTYEGPGDRTLFVRSCR